MADRKTTNPKTKRTTRAAGAAGRNGRAAGVTVRMYRQGLGDCFLLTFPGAGGKPFHVLIDCGVILGTPNPAEIMTRVAQDVAATTGNRLDVLVATHEHWDHLSGFVQAQAIFDKIEIGEVWFAWTEDPADELANRLREGRKRTLRALRDAVTRLTALDHPSADRVQGLVNFFGAAAGGQTTRAALDYLADHPSRPKVRYRRPGEPPVALPGVEAARVFVLGPPHDEKLIKRINPTKTGHEVYEFLGREVDPDAAYFAALGGSDEDAALAQRCQAFEENMRITPAQAAGMPFFQQYYPPSAGADPNDWRRIDEDWLGTTEELALNLDSDTNNTSLALAFELSPGGGVLLFPGDAQVGNWLSWADCSWKADRAGDPPMTAADLVKRTVLYKVGHHASHNATLRAKGLELMESPDLVALIPVDHKMAVKKRWNGMPFPSLLTRLEVKARGRVLRIDDKLKEGDVPPRPDDAPAALWKQFTDRLLVKDLYFDYTV